MYRSTQWTRSTRSLAPSLLIAGALAAMVLAPTASRAQGDPPPGSARLAHLEGNVSFQPTGSDQWGQAEPNQPVGAGERIYTDGRSRGELQAGPVQAYFSAGSDVTLMNINAEGVEIGLASGSLNVFSDGFFGPNESLFISTPNGGITLRTRGKLRVDVYPDQQSTVISVPGDGFPVQLNGAGGFNLELIQGQAIQLSGTNPVYSQPLEPAPYDEFAHWSGGLESHRFNSEAARYVSPEMAGYDELDGNGQWQPESEYGPIWFPRVEPGWAPYHNGHWVNRPFYGWTWVAEEPWGAAPFHYGRWVQIGGRWGWLPGPREAHPVWSPAQVVFAGGIQFGGVGVSVWFPLGPGEAYKPWYPCSPEYVNRINITNIRESKVVHVQNTYVNIVNVTNVTNITYVNRTTGVTAMRQEDFAAGKSAKTVAVKIDPKQVEHVQPAPPAAKPPAQPIILRPIVKPPAAPVARPVLINHTGQQVEAKPNAKPIPVPVKAAPPVIQPIPGRAAIGAPSVNGKPAPVAAPAKPMVPAKPDVAKPDAKKPMAPMAPMAPMEKPVPAKPVAPMPAEKPMTPRPNTPPSTARPEVQPVPAAKPGAPAPKKDPKKPEDKKPEDKKPA